MKKVLVIIHKSRLDETPVLDVLVHSSVSEKLIRELMKNLDEPANCRIVNEFLSKNPDYIHIGSIDFLHAFEYNAELVKTLLWLGRKNPEVLVIPPKR